MATSAPLFTLASASDVVHVWEVTGTADKSSTAPPQLSAPARPAKTLTPHARHINALQWNHNNSVLATGSADGSIALSGLVDCKLIRRLVAPAALSSPTGGVPNGSSAPVAALAFSSGSRYLVGAVGTVALVFDLKHADSAPRRLGGHAVPVSALDFGSGDGTLASADEGGLVLVHNLSSHGVSSRLESSGPDRAPLRDLQHSPHRRNWLATCGDAGVVALWDLSSSSAPLASLKPSSPSGVASPPSPLTCLRFSPTSSSLLATAGLDRRLVFFDANSRKGIREVVADESISCMDFHSDGMTLALGTASGSVLMYDIRAASKPTARIPAHESRTVRAIKFQQRGPSASASASAVRKSVPGSTAASSSSSVAPASSTSSSSAAAAVPASSPAATTASVYDSKRSTVLDTRAPTSAGAAGMHPAAPPAASQHNYTLPAGAASHSYANSSLSTTLTNQTAPPAPLPSSSNDALFSPVKSASGGAGAGSMLSPPSAAGSAAVGVSSFMRPGAVEAFSPPSSATFGGGGRGGYAADPSLLLTPMHGSSVQSRDVSLANTSSVAPSSFPSSSSASVVAQPAHLVSSFAPPPRASSASTASVGAVMRTAAAPMPSPPSSAPSFSPPAASPSALSSLSSSPPAAAAASVPVIPRSVSSPPRATRREADSLAAADSGASSASSSTQLVATPSRSRLALPSPLRDAHSSPSTLGGGGAGAGGGLSEYQAGVLRGLLDESLYSLRSELRAQVSDMHVEMIKQFHAAQSAQQRQMDALITRLEGMVNEVKQLRDDYKHLKHIY